MTELISLLIVGVGCYLIGKQSFNFSRLSPTAKRKIFLAQELEYLVSDIKYLLEENSNIKYLLEENSNGLNPTKEDLLEVATLIQQNYDANISHNTQIMNAVIEYFK